MATGKYTFIPWLKEGLALSNEVIDTLGVTSPTSTGVARGHVTATLNYTADGAGTNLAGKTFNLFGPGDVVGVKDEAIINKYPAPNALTAEPNYLPYIEFYDEDFPWRYTPAIADTATSKRLTPWLALVALKAEEFEDQKNFLLPAIKVKTIDSGGNPIPLALPENPYETLWAWSHVQISDTIDSSTDELLTASIKNVRTDNPDAIISRIMCPRKSEPNTTYHLFLVPTFENGRLAGLGLLDENTEVDVMTMAWDSSEVVLPYYQRWSYTTSENEDFESLIDELAPITMNPQAGVRYFDFRTVQNSFENSLRFPVNDPATPILPETTTDKWGLMGALKSPTTTVDDWTDPAQKQVFQEELREYLNKSNDRTINVDNGEVHPVVLPPIYGKWHSKEMEIQGGLYDGWVKDVNLELNNRATAGLGTDVVIDNQETFMDHAWEQVGEVIRANEAMNRAVLSKEVAKCYYNRHLKTFDTDKVLKLGKSVAKKIIPSGSTQTAYKEISESNLPNGNMERAFNRITRTGNRVTKSALVQAGINVNTSEAKVFYNNLAANVNNVSMQNITTAVPKDSISTSFLTTSSQSAIFSNLNAVEIANTSTPYYVVQTQPSAQIFQDLNTLGYETEAALPELDMPATTDVIVEAADPVATISDRFEYLISQVGQAVSPGKQLDQIQAAPHFRWPMYEHLLKISTDLMFPGLEQIPDNCVTLLETNNAFIQTFMLGLNHEMSRELLWREYPTDQRGTYFKQFWDSIDFVDDSGNTIDNESVEAIRQDISDIHGWDIDNTIGSASFSGDGTNPTAAVENNMVLVVRGEALRRYPNTIIYAQKAGPRVGENPRPLADENIAANIKFPIFQAKINDIVLLGFDLTATEVTDGDGWYFVFRERPGQTRFGMDVERRDINDLPLPPETITDWNDLSWTEALNSPNLLSASQIMNPRVGIAKANQTFPAMSSWPNESPTGSNTFEDTSSAEIGHALFQSPAMVAVHASKMLENL